MALRTGTQAARSYELRAAVGRQELQHIHCTFMGRENRGQKREGPGQERVGRGGDLQVMRARAEDSTAPGR